jgi:ribosomal-protein-alanine N-acetyltransferase
MMPRELRTERLRITPLRIEHVDDLYELYADPVANGYFDTTVMNLDDVRDMVRARLAEAPDGMGHCVFELDNEVVGLGKLRPSTSLPGGVPEIGWRLRRDHWGRGLATEASRSLLDHAFGTLRLASVWAIVHPDNEPSVRLAKRLGFRDADPADLPAGTRGRVFVTFPGDRTADPARETVTSDTERPNPTA